MLRLLLSRLLHVVLVMFLVASIVFVISRIIPGDPAAVALGADATTANLAKLRAEMGLDRPLLAQYAAFLGQVAKLDFGTSIFLGQPVTTVMLQRAELTIMLCLLATGLSVLVGLPLGIVGGVRRNGVIDRVGSLFAMLGASLPSFWIALVLIRYLAAGLDWFPVSGYGAPGADWVEHLHHLVLPALVLALPNAVLLLRTTRASMLEVMSQDYIRTARAKGLRPYLVVLRHALANAMLPIVTVIGLTVALLLGRTIVTETVFGLPGIGNLIVSAVLRRDYPVIQGALMIISALYVLINMAVDLLYARLDPRLREGMA